MLKGLIRQRAFSSSSFRLPPVYNEPLRNFAPESGERKILQSALSEMAKKTHQIPCIVGHQEVHEDDKGKQVICGDHKNVLATFSFASKDTIKMAIKQALVAKRQWERTPFHERAAIFLKAADLISNKYWPEIMSATMLGQGKNAWQAEIDSHAELVDFLRFNCKFAEDLIMNENQVISPAGVWNRMEWRGLEGFVTAISPFNFTAIGGNLATAPALMGNVVLWKPSSSAVHSNYLVHKALLEAGLPPNVIQFLPSHPRDFVDTTLASKDFAGIHFTGSTGVFQDLWQRIAKKVPRLRSFPRIVGETGGKNFHFVHSSASVGNVVHQTIRGAFEYQGQKCSACSRLYVPQSMWPEIKKKLVSETNKITIGDHTDFAAFMGPVINASAFEKITGYIDLAKTADHAVTSIIAGGKYDNSKGYFIHPTVIETKDPNFKTMKEEIFGPVLTVFVYPDAEFEKTLKTIDKTGNYALTGAIFANDRAAIQKASDILVNVAGNFYINDKCTGAVVGQQPFGGARQSGTNDKAGSPLNLLRWTSPRSVKESFLEIPHWKYPSNM